MARDERVTAAAVEGSGTPKAAPRAAGPGALATYAVVLAKSVLDG